MEFNQENRSFCTCVSVLDTVAEQLADVDLTLPDYCPDIEKILKCTLTPKIQSKIPFRWTATGRRLLHS